MAADEDTVAVTVRDYGVGLRPGEEKLVFSRFWRSDPSRVRQSGGTGLGLAISIEDARLHQSRLEAWGEPGKVRCFRLTLPLVRGHKVTTSPLPMKPVAAERRDAPHPGKRCDPPPADHPAAGRAGRDDAAVLRRGAELPRRRGQSGRSKRPAPRACPNRAPAWTPTNCSAEFLKATADPANRHLAARQFLTELGVRRLGRPGQRAADRQGGVRRNPLLGQVSVTMKADILGSLSDLGVFRDRRGQAARSRPHRTGADLGRLADQPAAQRVFLDWQQFQATYKRNTLYFVDPTGKTVVPDPRYVAVSDPDQLATELVNKLIAGPRPEMANTVRNLLAPPVKLVGPVTRADGGKIRVGRGYGGARVELQNVTTTDPHSRQLLAAQLIWTMAPPTSRVRTSSTPTARR